MILAINTLDLFVGFRDYPYDTRKEKSCRPHRIYRRELDWQTFKQGTARNLWMRAIFANDADSFLLCVMMRVSEDLRYVENYCCLVKLL